MLKKIFVTSIALFALTLTTSLFAETASAQSGPVLETPECPQIAWSCAQVTDENVGEAGKPHTQRLQQTGLPSVDIHGNPQKYIIACGIDTEEGFLATTGNNTLDREYCLSTGEFNTLEVLKTKYKYDLKLEGFTNPFTSNGGNIDKRVTPSNEGEAKTHMCMIGWILPVTTTGGDEEDPGQNEASKDTFGLEYTTFTFPIGAAQCTTVYADPYGRTYNSDLRPVPGVDVTISDFDSKSVLKLFGVPNPVRTGINGMFNFNVPPGRTSLSGSVPNLTEVHPNYSLAYTTPYTYGSLIIEALGKAEQRDIAVNGGGTPVLNLTGYSYVRTGDHIMIQGSASWPLTLVSLMQGNTTLIEQQSSKFGNFEFRIDPSKIDPTEQITVKLTEVDLTANPKAPAASPATDKIVLDPIPAYLEGYAYDAAGNLVPFATIRVRMTLTDAIYYETKADASAFYTVEPRNIPILPYYLEIIPANNIPVITGTGGTDVTGSPLPSGTVVLDPKTGLPVETSTGGSNTTPDLSRAAKIATAKYASQNKEYHDVNVIDIMAATKNGTAIDPSAVADTSSAVFGDIETGSSQDSTTTTSDEDATAAQSAQQRYLTLLILVVLLVFVGTGAVLLIRKKGRHDVLAGSGQDVYTKEDAVANPKEE